MIQRFGGVEGSEFKIDWKRLSTQCENQSNLSLNTDTCSDNDQDTYVPSLGIPPSVALFIRTFYDWIISDQIDMVYINIGR